MTERTKLVVRHLPPNLPEEVFWKTLSRWLEPTSREDGTIDPPKCTAISKSYLPGKVRRNKTKVEIPSRAYIQFATPDQVVEFHQGYATQAFRDSHGNLTFPKVEFAPFQKVAGPPKKIDNRIGTIDADQEYQAFLETLNAPVVPEPSARPTKPDAALEKVEGPEITPLIEHLRNARKAAQEAAVTAKQQRQAANSGKSTSSRPFAAPPQIMKKAEAINGKDTAADFPTRKSDDPAPRDPPPHMLNSIPSSSKGIKQTSKSSSTVPPSTSQATSSGSNTKSRSNKSSKSKRSGRGTEDQSTNPPAPEAQGKSSAPPPQPKMILQPPKPSHSNSDKPSSSSKNPNQSPSKAGNPSGKKQGSCLPEQVPSTQNSQAKPANSVHEGSGGSKKPGRAGKGKKASSGAGNPASQPAEPSAPPSSATPATQKAKSDEPAKTEPSGSSETAAARRRLGNALAGITSKADRPPRRKQNPTPAPPPSSNPPPAA